MKNNYKDAVDYLEVFVKATDMLYTNNPSLVGMESKLEYAIAVLKSQSEYHK